MPHVASDDLKPQIEAALLYRDHLLLHLQNSLRPGGTPLRLIGEPSHNSAEAGRDRRALLSATQTLLNALPVAEIVLWRPDLMLCAERQADYYADVLVAQADLPRTHEFWCFFGSEIASRGLDGTHKLFLQVLLSGATADSPFACLASFYFPYEGNTVLLDRPPLVNLVPPLEVGHSPQGIEAQRLLACLSFRAQPFVEDAPANFHHTRPERRRMEREGRTPPSVCVINPRMKEQRPIWVNAYVKGPEDKPLKPPTRKVTAVKR